jgi:hypothetical protein
MLPPVMLIEEMDEPEPPMQAAISAMDEELTVMVAVALLVAYDPVTFPLLSE